MTIAATITAPPGADRHPIAAGIAEFMALRHDLHRHPELGYAERRTSAKVADLLKSWGYHVETGVAGTGVVGTLRNGNGKRLGLRADMDALPILEATGLEFASAVPGVMHACGHDGHTTILLAAAKYLAETRSFQGTLHLIFQPAEELGAGARRMIEAGLFDRYPVDAVFALHNWPGLPEGQFAFVSGPAMAAIDKVDLRVRGKGGHGAAPHETIDPVVAAAHAVAALQSVVSRNVNPLDPAVVTVGAIHGGEASNVIPDSVEMNLTLRSFSPQVRDLLESRVPAILRGVVEGFGAKAELIYARGFPAVINHAAETALAADVATELFGAQLVDRHLAPRMASEDFAFLLQARPGSYFFVGTGPGAPLHSPEYRFNDNILAPAAIFWAQLTETFLNGAQP